MLLFFSLIFLATQSLSQTETIIMTIPMAIAEIAILIIGAEILLL
jgi:hypothetical protein